MLGGSLLPQQGTSLGCRWRNSLQPWKVAVNTLNNQPHDLLADSHNILNRWKNYFSQLLNVHDVNYVR
jgi:hypothetical protein